jgi:hypothetical protein
MVVFAVLVQIMAQGLSLNLVRPQYRSKWIAACSAVRCDAVRD